MYEGEGMFNENQMETSGKPADDGQASTGDNTQGDGGTGTTTTDDNLTDEEKEKQGEDGKSKDKKDDETGLTEEEKKKADEAGTETDDENLSPEEKQAKIDAKLKEEQDAKDELANQERQKIKDEAIAELLKKHNVTSEEELEKKLNPVKELTEEEKAQKAEIYNASLAKYAIENKVFKSDELLQYQNMKTMAPQELVYSQFEKEYREAHKDRVDAEQKAEPVTDDEVKDAFAEMFHIGSDNKRLSDMGQRALEAQAKAMIAPMEQKYNDLKEVYDADMSQKAAIPEFKNFLQTTITEAIPTQIELGEGDDKVVFKFEKIDKEAIEKLFVNNEEFETFRSGNATEQQKQRITERVKEHVLAKHVNEIAKVVGDVRHDAGVRKGAKGSQVPFDKDEQRNDSPVSTKTVTKEENQKVADSFNV